MDRIKFVNQEIPVGADKLSNYWEQHIQAGFLIFVWGTNCFDWGTLGGITLNAMYLSPMEQFYRCVELQISVCFLNLLLGCVIHLLKMYWLLQSVYSSVATKL